ncbi:hypothetical protein PRZ48_005103 [Zasmidium cellare]|uniref:Core Histone H2A/H2B/H3 domain-containing protein n=1 Tax=Zasmidium cellare TaxID=395010 RepID=A0ABR0ERT5_ZASCE|nr:hypothetical protein PRZ48_005103 [Zasmidium cellare]
MARTKQTARKARAVDEAFALTAAQYAQLTSCPTSPPETVLSNAREEAQSTTQEAPGTQSIISKSVFHALVQEAMEKHNVQLDFQQASLDFLQAHMEDYLAAVMEQADVLAKQEGRDVVESEDFVRAKLVVEQKMAEAAVEREAVAGHEVMTDGEVGKGV